MSNRPAMMGSVIREQIAPILRMCPRVCGIVTITEVEVSADSSYATVYVSALKEPKVALEFFKEHRGELQKNIGSLNVWRAPKLRFRIDERSERGSKIESLLKE